MRFHGRDLRKGRVSEPGRIYLLTTVTHGRLPLFQDWRLGRIPAMEMKALDSVYISNTLAWVVMPDHLHWLVELRQGGLKGLMQRLKSRSAVAINQLRGGNGPVWQKGYYDRALRQEDDLRAMARHVVANPLRAGLVTRIGDYPLWDAAWL